MELGCPRCAHVLTYDDRPPRFCSNCGLPLTDNALEPTVHGLLPRDPQGSGISSPPPAGSDPPGSNVGGYQLLRAIGGGGMGTVYEAEEAATGRRVALKLIRPEFAGANEAVERFRREGRLASTITHPRCVFVLAADEQAGRPYIVMELMPGRNLHDLVSERGPLPVEEAVGKILDIIDGLQEAHRRGVIHRDVKPSNCFLDDEGRVKVGDFGLAKSLIGPEVLTRSGAFLGTLLYASPEQIRNEPVNAQTDVYSVCATLYYLLTGQAPFQDGDSDPAATLARTVSDPLKPMRRRRPELPRALDEIVGQGLARQQALRWRSLEELRLQLLPFVEAPHTLDELGWRIGGYFLDLLLLIPIELTAQQFAHVTNLDGAAYGLAGQLLATLAIGLACGLAYFAVAEWLWGGTPGKLLMRLRVRESSGHDRPHLWRAALRTFWFYVFRDFGAFLASLVLAWFGTRFGGGSGTARLVIGVLMTGLLPFLSGSLGLAVVVVTMRRRNGYRGLHEWLSGTEVIRLPARRPRLEVPDRSSLYAGQLAPGVPQQIGAFTVRSVLRDRPDERVLACEDAWLTRPVWVWMRRQDFGPADGRHEVARPTRSRWLSGGEENGWHWEAFVATPGCLLADLVSRPRPMQWADALPLLEQLAEELEAAQGDGTSPASLSVMQVWIQESGRALLLDMPLRPSEPADSPVGLLRQVAVLALEGKSRPPREANHSIRAPLPEHAAALLDRLMGLREPFNSLGEVRAALAAARDRPAEITRPRRGMQLLLSGAFLVPGLGWLFSMGLLFLATAYLFCVAGQATCQYALETFPPREGRDFPRLLRRLESERVLVLASWNVLVRQQLTAQEEAFRLRYIALLRGGDAGPSDLIGRWGDDLLEGPRLLTEQLIDRPMWVMMLFAGWPLAWCVWSALTRGGLMRRLAGITLRTRDGRPASRWRCALRSLLLWGPVTALLLASFWLDVWRVHHGPDPANQGLLEVAAWLAWWGWWQALLLLPLYAWLGMRWPNRGLHDRIAGTYPVPV